jgi:ribosomal protein S4
MGESFAEKRTPYMHMTFHPLERRLDTSIFRALFASSTRQARQFVVHGFVKVNGKKMKYPGYQLNPGDMFSVEPEMVLFATGARKVNKNDNRSNLERERAFLRRQAKEEETKEERERRKEQEAEEVVEEEVEEELAEGETTTTADSLKTNYSTELRSLMKRAKTILADSKRDLSGKSKIELRNFTREVKKVFNKLNKTEDAETEETLEGLETALAEILTKVPQDAVPQSAAPASTDAASTDPAAAAAASSPNPSEPNKENANRARKDAELLHAALLRARANPIDESKPYATPWEPREFMSAFAFIPRYLEVNQNICSAVYLRHPVARPGLAEVPTPFSAETMALGFNWYLRRR